MDENPSSHPAVPRSTTSKLAEGGDWRRNDRRIIPKSDQLLDHGIYGLHPQDPRGRPFILLRSQVLNALRGIDGKVVAITSATALNGKSHIAANLACALSRVRETSLVDLHLRRPVIGDRFGLPEGEGITTHLSGDRNTADTSFRIQDERLQIYAAGAATEDSSDVLLSPHVNKLFDHVRAEPGESVCIIDTPPVLESDDMLLISKQVDAVLFVVEEGRTTKHEVVESFRLLNGTPVIGTLLNKSISQFESLYR